MERYAKLRWDWFGVIHKQPVFLFFFLSFSCLFSFVSTSASNTSTCMDICIIRWAHVFFFLLNDMQNTLAEIDQMLEIPIQCIKECMTLRIFALFSSFLFFFVVSCISVGLSTMQWQALTEVIWICMNPFMHSVFDAVIESQMMMHKRDLTFHLHSICGGLYNVYSWNDSELIDGPVFIFPSKPKCGSRALWGHESIIHNDNLTGLCSDSSDFLETTFVVIRS